MTEFSTPLMKQYGSIKERHPQALLFFRLGDFYELFFEDAIVAARELQITLTSRNREKGQAIPMCGVPYHAADAYIGRLVRKGFRVALCDQMEEANSARKLVRRAVTRVVSPGTSLEAQALDPRANNYLAAAVIRDQTAGLAFADLSTGDFRATEFRGPGSSARARDELERIHPSEILFARQDSMEADMQGREAGAALGPALDGAAGPARTPVEAWVFAEDYGARLLREHFQIATLAGYGLEGRDLAISAAGAILHYVKETQRGSLLHLDGIRYEEQQDSLLLDPVTLRNLEVVEPAFGSSRDSTLLSSLDHCMTVFGARLLKQRILRPYVSREEIESRWQAVEELQRSTVAREELRRSLSRIQDLERLLSRIVLETANARDLLALKNSLDELPGISILLQEFKSPLLSALRDGMDPLADVRGRIEQSIHPEPPATLTEGDLIRSGYNAELDSLRDLSHSSKRLIAQIEARERDRTRIASLKVRFNNIFGYYIEISKSNLHLAPPDYERKQTLVNAERFTTPELKELETRILEAEEKRQTLERDLFSEVRRQTGGEARRIRAAAATLAEIDVLACFAWLAAERNYRRPEISSDGELVISEGRHPVIERIQAHAGAFIPNNLFLDSSEARILILTGPNMGGKSTYLRQTALISVMAQMGGFVPASRAKLPIFDRIYTRIGASDNLARGQSTFMVEMTEAAAILNTASSRSLILLDEIGRGTATFDGLAIAWAVVEYLQARTQAKTLFATHYHELTELAELLPGIRNYHVAVKESGSTIVFLRKVEPGAADKSYGVEVARLAGLPLSVIERAREILARHEQSEHRLSERLEARQNGKDSSPVQLTIFTPLDSSILRAIEESDLDHMRPVDALALLAQLKNQLQS